MSDKSEATRLADALMRSAIPLYPGTAAVDLIELTAAASLLRCWPDGEPDEERIGTSIYRGNTVSYMYRKAKAYGDIVLSLWGMLAEAGYKVSGENHVKDMLARCIETARTQSERIAALEWEREHLLQEARVHAMEAKTANATIAEIYQAVTGKTGEPGNWHGANPVRERIASLEAENATLRLERDQANADRKQMQEAHAALEAALDQARVALENVDMAPLVRDALRAIEEVRK